MGSKALTPKKKLIFDSSKKLTKKQEIHKRSDVNFKDFHNFKASNLKEYIKSINKAFKLSNVN